MHIVDRQQMKLNAEIGRQLSRILNRMIRTKSRWHPNAAYAIFSKRNLRDGCGERRVDPPGDPQARPEEPVLGQVVPDSHHEGGVHLLIVGFRRQ